MCDIGYIVKDHVPAVLQLITSDIPFMTHLITTKCLNTAVMFMYLFLGDKAFKHTSVCDVSNVRNRYQKADQSLSTLQAFRKDVLSFNDDASRTLFYVMLTDGELGAPASKASDAQYFPGHVFVIEKNVSCDDVGNANANANAQTKTNTRTRTNAQTNAQTNARTECRTSRGGLDASAVARFNLYQSYINAYDFSGHVAKNKGLSCSHERMTSIVDSLIRTFTRGVWDADATAFWKDFAFADAAPWEGHTLAGKVYFCYTRVTTRNCVSKLKQMLTKRRSDLVDMLEKNPDMHAAVYGCAHASSAQECFNLKSNSVQPMTNSEMLVQIDAMLKKI